MDEVRECAQCGTPFTPRREHARFCSARCRMTWNREHAGVAAAPAVAIDWSVTAMTEAAGRLAAASAWELPRLAAAVGETVWWVTLVDATLVRYHPRDYESALASRDGRRRKTEETLEGLRYVRNQLGRSVDPAEFVCPVTGDDSTAWAWRPLPEPGLGGLTPRARQWELSRYRAYQARLVGRDIARTFARCTEFLSQAAGLVGGGAPPGLGTPGLRARKQAVSPAGPLFILSSILVHRAGKQVRVPRRRAARARRPGPVPGGGPDRLRRGFFGAGLIFVRRDSVCGLTTAAAVWVTAAIGAATGAGLPVLAVEATAAFLIVTTAFPALARSPATASALLIRYPDGRGVLRQLMQTATAQGFTIGAVSARSLAEPAAAVPGTRDCRPMAEVSLHVHGKYPVSKLAAALSEIEDIDAVLAGDASPAGE